MVVDRRGELRTVETPSLQRHGEEWSRQRLLHADAGKLCNERKGFAGSKSRTVTRRLPYCVGSLEGKEGRRAGNERSNASWYWRERLEGGFDMAAELETMERLAISEGCECANVTPRFCAIR